MEATQVKADKIPNDNEVEKTDLEHLRSGVGLRELAAFELALVGGGTISVAFV